MKTQNEVIHKEPNESVVRRKAHRRLWKLKKFSERSRWYNQYGPYGLVNDLNLVEHHALSLDEANQVLDEIEPALRGVDYLVR
jgi:hypothetical protein